MELKGKVVVITGAAGALGKRFALDLISAGCVVVGFDVDEDSLLTLEKEIRGSGCEFRGIGVDVTDEESVASGFSRVIESFGRVDVLINNAGITGDHLLVRKSEDGLEKFPLSLWEKVIRVNLTGVFLCGREAAYWMVEKGVEGVIVNISSISREGNVGQSSYSATKAGVVALTVTWAKELSRYGIRVGAVAPGFVDTPMARAVPEKVMSKVLSTIPAGRLATTEEVSMAVRFILENDYFNGRVVEVDGGLRI